MMCPFVLMFKVGWR